MTDHGISFGGFLRWVRWVLPSSMALFLVLWLVDLKGLRQLPLYVPVVVFPVLFAIVLGPLVWLRFEHAAEHSDRFWVALVLAFAWLFVGGALCIVLIAAIVPD